MVCRGSVARRWIRLHLHSSNNSFTRYIDHLKILFTIDTLQQGGAEQSIANIIRHFSPDSKVSVLYFYPKADLLPLYETLPCKVFALNLLGKYNWWKGVRGMQKIIKEENPDIVVTSLYRSNLISRVACLLSRKKLIGTFVDDPYNKERKNTFKGIGRIKYGITWLVDRMTAFICYAWISNSFSIGKSNAGHLGISQRKIKIIYRGRDINQFPLWTEPVSDDFHFISIGRLYEKKGYPELLEAFAQLSRVKSEARLHIYGEGAYQPVMEAYISKHGLAEKIILHGNVTGAWKHIYQAHCFVFPSRFEGFSGALVEAMMTGVPIICSDIPMNLEAVEHQQSALVHRLRDTKDLVDKMMYMMDHFEEMKKMGERARNLALEKYDIRKIAKQYECQLSDFVAGNL